MSRLSRTKEEKQILDRRLQEAVHQYQQLYRNNEINWINISQKLFLKYSIKLNNKQCAQRYLHLIQRYKNYSSKSNQPQLKLTPQQQEEIFLRHSEGEKAKKIKDQMGLQLMSDNTLKNTLKKQKERLGRILKKVLHQDFSSIEFDSKKIQSKDQFRVIIILFSTSPILKYYKDKGFNMKDFKNKIFEFENLHQQVLKKNCQQDKVDERMSLQLQKLERLKTSIKRRLQLIFYSYQEVYSNPSLSKELIGLREMKNSKEKYIYTKAIITGKPLKVCRDQQDLPLSQEGSCDKFAQIFQEKNQEENSQQVFNSNFFDQQIIDCSFQKDFPFLSASSKKFQTAMTMDEEDASPKFVLTQEEPQNPFENYLQ